MIYSVECLGKHLGFISTAAPVSVGHNLRVYATRLRVKEVMHLVSLAEDTRDATKATPAVAVLVVVEIWEDGSARPAEAGPGVA